MKHQLKGWLRLGKARLLGKKRIIRWENERRSTKQGQRYPIKIENTGKKPLVKGEAGSKNEMRQMSKTTSACAT